MLVPTYQPFGSSTHQLAKKASLLFSEPTSHTGTLDPMAAGVVILTTGNERFAKSEFANFHKHYAVKVLLGIETDSHDVLGLTTIIDDKTLKAGLNPDKFLLIEQELVALSNTKVQTQHPFSAQRVNGHSAFDLAKLGQSFQLNRNQIEITDIKVSRPTVVWLNQLNEKLDLISKLNGDFRQNEVISSWNKTFAFLEKKGIGSIPSLNLEISCSKRTYVRSLIRDLSVPAICFEILRTQNGPYTIQDCICLI